MLSFICLALLTLLFQNAETEELKNTRDNLTRKLKIREKHLRSLEEDNGKMAEALQQKKQEFDQVRFWRSSSG